VAHKCCVTVILPVTYFTMCYMIVLPKLCPVVVIGLEEAIQRSQQEDAPAVAPLAVTPPPPAANVWPPQRRTRTGRTDCEAALSTFF
jgi:hypothetical protein